MLAWLRLIALDDLAAPNPRHGVTGSCAPLHAWFAADGNGISDHRDLALADVATTAWQRVCAILQSP